MKDAPTPLQCLPKIDDLLQELSVGAGNQISPAIVKRVCQQVVEAKREELLAGSKQADAPAAVPLNSSSKRKIREEIIAKIGLALAALTKPRLLRVINATGVILHTNLGRSPLSTRALANVVTVASGYTNLEFSLTEGKRGSRYDNLRELACLLTGAEDVVVVNNNAAAVMLILDTLAGGREVIVSRGELVEIGGGFRIPEVLQKSGAMLKEVGTTNRTRIHDYADAITANTSLLLKVHTSNFRLVGFCEDTPLEALVALGKARNIPVAYDVGSGSMVDLSPYGIGSEPVITTVLASGVDVVSLSGDKLLGGPQAGIILGKREIIKSIRQNPLNRALRVDKLTLAALEGTFLDYLQAEEGVFASIYPLRYLSLDVNYLKREAKHLVNEIRKECGEGFTLAVVAGKSFAGGGALPHHEMDSVLVALRHPRLTAEQITAKLRTGEVPVIARIANEEVLFDLRTLERDEHREIAGALGAVARSANG